ncbi:MAG: crossover junction endodeoxyribonuclease RuvC [bacterium]|nr:crossover junction endodeoxyribonuclease RuvC [bacterium]
MHNDIIIGIDPGSNITGYGLIELKTNSFFPIDYGVIDISKENSRSKSLEFIFKNLSMILETFNPRILSLEKVFYYKNVKTSIVLGEVRGIILLLAGLYNLEVLEFSSTQIKSSLTGYGRADKSQVRFMVKKLLSVQDDIPTDASDALALCLCAGLEVLGRQCFPTLKVHYQE